LYTFHIKQEMRFVFQCLQRAWRTYSLFSRGKLFCRPVSTNSRWALVLGRVNISLDLRLLNLDRYFSYPTFVLRREKSLRRPPEGLLETCLDISFCQKDLKSMYSDYRIWGLIFGEIFDYPELACKNWLDSLVTLLILPRLYYYI
jgi:hypothetical protein